MVYEALTFIKDQLNNYVMYKTGSAVDKVGLVHVVKQDGGGAIDIPANTVGMSLINIEEERVMKEQKSTIPTGSGSYQAINPEIKLNLYLLFAAYSDSANYDEALKLLSHVITFFQAKSVFTPQNSPALDSSIEKLILDLYTIPLEQQNYLWGSIGGRYIPSVTYRSRLLVIQDAQALEEVSQVATMDLQLQTTN